MRGNIALAQYGNKSALNFRPLCLNKKSNFILLLINVVELNISLSMKHEIIRKTSCIEYLEKKRCGLELRN